MSIVGEATIAAWRPEYEVPVSNVGTIADVARPLSRLERLTQNSLFRRLMVLVVLAVIWEAYASYLNNDLLFPRFSETMVALWTQSWHGPLLSRTLFSLEILAVGYSIGIVLAGVLVVISVSTKVGDDVLSALTSMFNPLPAIALLPLALLWFGLGVQSIIFVVIHSVLWAVALNTHVGFKSVSQTLKMAGQNFGLRGLGYIGGILLPAAFPSILSGLKIGWAFAWRTLIAAELVFGATSRQGGLGWFIFENRNSLETSNVFAGLFTVIIIGLLVESVVFRAIELRTICRWGMQQ
jgi:NitT/TauT family transport system permease protein